MHILLDSCALLWLADDPTRLGPALAQALDEESTRLWLSDCSVMELCLKWTAGKLRLPQPPRIWLEEQVSIWEIRGLAVERRHHYRCTELPDHHKDPFDRLLVAQAIEEGLTIATPDSLIRRYPVATIW